MLKLIKKRWWQMTGEKGKYDPEIHHRRSIRLKGYDYARPGAYFVTIDLQEMHSRLFGEVVDAKVQLTRFGEIVWKCWKQLPRHYANVKLDEFVVMPNHVHGIIWLAAGVRVGAGLAGGNVRDVKPARTIEAEDGAKGAGAVWQEEMSEM